MTTEVGTATIPPPAGYPVRLTIQRPERQSRLTNFPLGVGAVIRWILLIPHFIILFFLEIAAGLLYFIATFAILFTGRYPMGMYNFVAGYLRWTANVNAYSSSLYDAYPPFSTDAQAGYPLAFVVEYPDRSSRLLNLPLFGYMIRFVLLIPHIVVLFFLGIAVFVVIFIAQFAILIGGSFPAGMHRFVTGVTQWSTRITAYTLGLTDRYPPFSLQ
jgi:hypothetical protein